MTIKCKCSDQQDGTVNACHLVRREEFLKDFHLTPRGINTWLYIPAHISEGLEVQLLQLLLAEPVAHPAALQEGLHLQAVLPVPLRRVR